MKATGIVRKVDELGRIVIPKELRRTLNINEGDSLDIYTNGERIMLKKYAPGCTLCGSLDQLHTLEGKNVCLECRIKIGRTLGR